MTARDARARMGRDARECQSATSPRQLRPRLAIRARQESHHDTSNAPDTLSLPRALSPSSSSPSSAKGLPAYVTFPIVSDHRSLCHQARDDHHDTRNRAASMPYPFAAPNTVAMLDLTHHQLLAGVLRSRRRRRRLAPPLETPPVPGEPPSSTTSPCVVTDHRRSAGEPPTPYPRRGQYTISSETTMAMEQLNHTKFYQLGNGGSLIFERDLDALSEFLERPHPEFFGTQVNDQPGGELQESNWLDGLARALQEALARLCGQNVTQIQGTRFAHFARHDSIGGPMALSPHPELKYHVEHLDFMLHETHKELDNSRVYANQTHLHLLQQTEAIKMLAKDRKSLRQQRAKKDSTIARLRAKIASLEETVQAQETQLRELEEEGEDIQGGAAYLSDDDDFEEDENTDVEDYEFMEAGEDDFIPIDVDDE
ncbi:hypothetical protein QYE76_022492 [Lolium multiflorum]|uniref:Uncharacterized protein n=1 Tax=Lolium multiflorum TaxID=4521 RepID=A0AAD8RA17_LOLMU|nr:hypothetical protein QYE76_022492 [Lolium multiflorum]